MYKSLKSSVRWAVLASSVAMLAAAPAWGQQDTWTGVERIVAVGDVHGDCDQFVKVLRAAKVIDANGNWNAGRTHLVQTGDVLDRGPDSRKAMDLLMKLEAQAAEANGAVHALLGNHEAMVLLDDWRYVHEAEIKAFGGEKEYRQAMSAEGKYGRWIRGHNAVIKVNDVLFAHGGLTTAVTEMTLAQINKSIRDELKNADGNVSGSVGSGSGGLAMSSSGPLWDRVVATEDEGLVAKELDAVFKAYGAKRLVVGHTVSNEGVADRAEGRLIRIDVGMSGFYGGPAACLVIEKGAFYEVRDGVTKPRLLFEAPASRPATQPSSQRAQSSGRAQGELEVLACVGNSVTVPSFLSFLVSPLTVAPAQTHPGWR